MHIHFLDPYHAGDSPWHLLDPRVKLILTVGFILTVALMPTAAWPGYVLAFALTISVAILSGLGALFAVRRAFLALPFVLAALPVLLMTEGAARLHLPLGLTLTREGAERFLSIAFKSWISVQAGILLAATTEFPRLLMAMRAVGLPRLLVAVFGLMWRYMFVLADEALRLMRARDSRSAAAAGRAGGSVIWRARVTGSMAGSLFLRGYERSERVYNAMLARGYDGEPRSFPLPPMSRHQWAMLTAGLLLLASLLAIEIILE